MFLILRLTAEYFCLGYRENARNEERERIELG